MFKPNFIVSEITDVSVDFLKSNNIEALLLDVDNTLSVAHGVKTLREGVPEWLYQMSESGIKMLVLSNASKKRAKAFADTISLDCVGLALKPLPFGYIKAIKKFGIKRKKIAMIGDQLFTDMLGAKMSGIKTFWVTNITPEPNFIFKIKRKFERILLKRWKNER